MANRSRKSTETGDYLSTICKIPTSLPQEQAAKTDMLSVVSIQVLRTFEEGVAMLAYD